MTRAHFSRLSAARPLAYRPLLFGLGSLLMAGVAGRIAGAEPTAPHHYYVDPAVGRMTNPGTAQAPWSTLEAVLAAQKVFAPGDVIHLRSGQHGFARTSGRNADDVTIVAEAGQQPVISRVDFNGAEHWVLEGVKIYTPAAPPDRVPLVHPVYPVFNDSLLRITAKSAFITIRNCVVCSAPDIAAWTADDWNKRAWTGIYLNGASHHLTIDRCTVRNVNFAIHMSRDAHHLAITNSLVENFCGDGLRAGCDDLLIEGNTIRDVYKTNGNHYDLIQGFASSRVVIRGNILLNATSRRALMCDAQAIGAFDGWFDAWVVENNIVASGHWHGITLLGARHCRVVNNTVVRNPFGIDPGKKPWIQIGPHKNGTASSDNVCRNNLTSALSTLSGTVASHNLETTDYTANFVNYAGLDFHLKRGSPAIDAGTTTDAPAFDFEKQRRVSPYDIGADEFQ